ncbi:MAG: pyridoxal phosphate-dependent aminotransferase [Planctomycetota bacterium]|nr:pyridoxal phosphate-dependent aminotransferase [Planctomycetota bacterium]
MRFNPFQYMKWAKEQAGKEWDCSLAASGMPALSMEDLGLRPEDIRIDRPGLYGDPELRGILARRYGVPESRVIIAAGTSLANFLVLGALLEPADEAIVETPTYESLPRIVEMLGAKVVPLARTFDEEFRVIPARLREAVTPRTRAIILTSLHNPSGVGVPEETLREIGEIADRSGALVIVDEVYIEYLPEGAFPRAATLGDPFVSTSSLTKAYGLGGLRVGWAVGPEPLIRKAHELHDLLDVECSAPSQSIAVRFFDGADAILSRTIEHLKRNYGILSRWAEDRGDIDLVPPDGGASAFPRLPPGVSSLDLSRRLMDEFGTVVVPGDFFEAPGFLRISFGGETGDLEEGLRRLGRAIDVSRD